MAEEINQVAEAEPVSEAEPAPKVRAEPMVRMEQYLKSLDKTRDAVYKKLIRHHSVQRARTASGWDTFLEDLKNKPAQ